MVNASITGASSVKSSGASNVNFAKKTESSVEFSTLMNASLNAKNNKTSINLSDTLKTNAETGNDTKSVDNKTTKTYEKSQQYKQSRNDSSDKDVDLEIDKVLKDVKEQIKKTFGLTDEELQGFLDNLGIAMQDLLMPSNLTNLVAEIAGVDDALALLTDSDLSEQLKSLMDYVDSQISNLSENLNVSSEQLKEYIETLSAKSKDTEGLKQPETVMNTLVSDDEKKANVLHDDRLETIIENRMTVESSVKTESASTERGQSQNEKQSKSDNTHVFTDVAANLAQNIENAFSTIQVEGTSKIDTTSIIQQILDAVNVRATEEISSMEIQLNPENLGKINLSVVIKDGIITAQLTAQDEAVKKAIETQLLTLKENLNNQGLKVEAIEVTVESHGYEANQQFERGNSEHENQNKKTRSALRLDSLNGLSDDEMSEEEISLRDTLINENSSVEYTA